MRKTSSIGLPYLVGFVSTLLLLADVSFSQIRPTIIDSGEVKETKVVRVVNIDKRNLGPTKASRASYSTLIVLTDPKDAEVKINGVSQGKATDGKFRKELPIGKKCAVEVTAGADYEPFSKTVMIRSSEPEIVEAAMTYKYGSVKIFPAMDGVKLLLDGSAIPPGNIEVDKDNRTITIDKLPAGQHRITYDLKDYPIYERNFTIASGDEETWNFIPEKAVGDLNVSTDPDTTVYVDGEEKGRTPANGALNVPAIKVGAHEIKLVKDGFEEYSETDTFEFKKTVPLAKKLVPIPTSAEFSDNFDIPNLSKWQAPGTGWTMKSGRLYIANAPAVGFPKNIVYRDFIENFYLQLVNGGGAAWAVRIKDANDYYLFYLSGPTGLFPNKFLTYIVKDGKFDPNSPSDSESVPVDLKAGQSYTINIHATMNVIEQSITPNSTGVTTNLGAFKDPNNSFSYGDIGFRTVGKESFAVDDLYVQPK
ncbi:MAG TPA: PEGA domain-containing protein [Blastocatellia bacterium]